MIKCPVDMKAWVLLKKDDGEALADVHSIVAMDDLPGNLRDGLWALHLADPDPMGPFFTITVSHPK